MNLLLRKRNIIILILLLSPFTLYRILQFIKLMSYVKKVNNNKNLFECFYNSISLIYKSIIIKKNQYFYGSQKIGKNLYIISYFHNNKWYYYPLRLKKGCKPNIINCTSDYDIDVTDYIQKFAGPNKDFYLENIKLNDIGLNSLIVNYLDNDCNEHTCKFNTSDILSIGQKNI